MSNSNIPSLPVITKIESVVAFQQLLIDNPGWVVLKFGAEWCGPCKKIEGLVEQWFAAMPSTVQCCMIDVDESFELYGFLKSKRRVNGIPAILAYKKGNINYIPNDMMAGADVAQVNAFFQRCLN
jgi:thiol-disulfide isomerase/thioredoxin